MNFFGLSLENAIENVAAKKRRHFHHVLEECVDGLHVLLEELKYNFEATNHKVKKIFNLVNVVHVDCAKTEVGGGDDTVFVVI